MTGPAPALMCVLGPTAGGKSALAMALAQDFPLEIICLDSAQIYRDMDIGTAKPNIRERQAVPHHLLDFLDPALSYSAAQYRQDAAAAIADILARGRVPCLVGGTFLYLRALLDGLTDLPRANPALRARLEREAAASGWEALHERLAAADPQAGQRIHPNDARRIQRGLEILELTGCAPSTLYAGQGQAPWPGPVLKLAVGPSSRAELHERIARRFRNMIASGFVEEVARLRGRGDLHPDLPAMRAVGYRQIWEHLDGVCDLETAIARGIAATRQYAKRQLTWLRRESALNWCVGTGSELQSLARPKVSEYLEATAA